MKRWTMVLLFFMAGSILSQAQDVVDKVDWAKFLGRLDPVWTKTADRWDNGLYTGNGLMGAMVFVGPQNASLRFHIGRSDVADKNSRIPVGDLLLKTSGKITAAPMRLDLWNAEGNGTLTTDKGKVEWSSFTHSEQQVQVIEFKPTGGEKVTFEWSAGYLPSPGTAVTGRLAPLPEPAPTTSVEGKVSVSYQPINDGASDTAAWTIKPGKDGSQVLYISVGYSPKGDGSKKEAIDAVTKAAELGVESLRESHRAWWHKFWPESFISFPDTRLENFYWMQVYKMASGTRPDRPLLDLMGPWFRSTPWPRIWWNLNIQLTYWIQLASNRLELGESLCKSLDTHWDQLAKNAGQFSADSAAIGRSCGYDLNRAVGNEPCDLPWALHNYYLQYRFSMDDQRLREKLFPLLKRSTNYYLHLLKEGPDGKLHISNGSSPEYPGQPKVNPDCNIDLALLRWECQTCLAICERLKINDPQIPQWKSTLANLTPYPTNENGLMISASVPFAVSHRHYSHLLMVYPLYIMNPEQPENQELIVKSVNHWQGMPAALRGYSYTGASSICSALGRSDDAVKYVNMLLDKVILPNTLYKEGGPVIETPLSGAQSVHDILLSSWGDKIRIFPGVPDSWKDVTIHNMRAEGAFLVSAVRKGGKTQFVKITSLAGEPCRVATGMDKPVAEGDLKVKDLGKGVLELPLKKGESVVLHPEGAKPDMVIAPVEAKKEQCNFYGLH